VTLKATRRKKVLLKNELIKFYFKLIINFLKMADRKAVVKNADMSEEM